MEIPTSATYHDLGDTNRLRDWFLAGAYPEHDGTEEDANQRTVKSYHDVRRSLMYGVSW